MTTYCTVCGAAITEGAKFCPNCGATATAAAPAEPVAAGPSQGPVNEEPPRQSAGFGQGHQAEGSAGAGSVPPPPPNAGQGFGSAVQSGVDRLFPGRKSKLAAALLGIFLGAFGIHRFYLGFTTIGVIQLVLGLAGFVTCGITSLVSGIWGLVEGILILIGNINTDATGQPLTD